MASSRVAGVRPADLPRATPCAGWLLSDLLAHMIGQQFGFARAVRDGDAPAAAYEPVPFTPAAWRESADELLAAFACADLDGSAVAVELSPGPLPVRRILGAQLLDTVVHTWDVATALGEAFTPPEDVLAATAAVAATIPDRAHGPGAAFGDRLPPGGTLWADTLALVGRRGAQVD